MLSRRMRFIVRSDLGRFLKARYVERSEPKICSENFDMLSCIRLLQTQLAHLPINGLKGIVNMLKHLKSSSDSRLNNTPHAGLLQAFIYCSESNYSFPKFYVSSSTMPFTCHKSTFPWLYYAFKQFFFFIAIFYL